MSGIADEAQNDRMVASTMSQENYSNIQRQLNGGFDSFSLRAGRHGMVITQDLIAKARLTLKSKEEFDWEEAPVEITYKEYWTPGEWEEPELVITYKVGGKVSDSETEETQSKNVIPEGALHARLHHMDQDGITKKGIPVITEEEGGIV
jgi:hypothetical protein